MSKRQIGAVLLMLALFGTLIAVDEIADQRTRPGAATVAPGRVVATHQKVQPATRASAAPFVSSLSPDFSIFSEDGVLVFSLTAQQAAMLTPGSGSPASDCPFPQIWQAFQEHAGSQLRAGLYALNVNWRQRHIVSDGIQECEIISQ